jgi:3-oxoadipate enol-lactonase
MAMIDAGRGPVVLCLHGSPSPASDFAPLVDALRATHRVLVPDLPGYRGAPAPDHGDLLQAGQRELEEELAARGVRELCVVGFSLGAYRAFHLALRTGLQVRGLVALGGFAGLAPAEREGLAQLAGLVRQSVGDLDALRAVLPERMLSAAFRAAHPEVARQVMGWLDLLSPESLARELEGAASAEDLRPALGGLRIPVLARVGELDVAMPPAKSQEIGAGAPGARVQVVPGAGHALLDEDRAATVVAVVEWVRRAGAAG